MPVYLPPAFFGWWFSYDAYAPDDLRQGRLHRRRQAASLRSRSPLASLWRAREAKNVDDLRVGALGERREIARPACSATMAWFSAGWRSDYLRHDGPEHVMCFAPTRSGKGVGLVVPTLLSWPGSAVVHDIKGENWHADRRLARAVLRCLLFNPTDPRSAPTIRCSRSAAASARSATSRTSPTSWSIPEGALERRNHWEKTSHSLLVGAILHVLYAEEDKTLAGVATFLSDPQRPIVATLQAMMTTPHLGDGRRRIPSSPRLRASCSTSPRTSVPACCRPRCRSSGSIAIPSWRQVTSPVRLAHRRPGRGASAGLALPGGAAVRHLADQAAHPPGAEPDRPAPDRGAAMRRTGAHRLLMMLDEFPALGRLDFFETALAFMAGYGIALPDRPVAEPDREGLWRQQLDPRQLPCPRRLRDQ